MTDGPTPYLYGPVRRVLLTLVWGALHVAASCLAGLVYRKLAIHFGMDASPYITFAVNPLAGCLTFFSVQAGYLYAMGRALSMERSSIFPSSFNPSAWNLSVTAILGGSTFAAYRALLSVKMVEDRVGDHVIVASLGFLGIWIAWPVLTTIWARTDDAPQPA